MESQNQDKRWFVARVRNGQELRMREKFLLLGIVHYIPSKQVTRVRNHKRCKVDAPVIPNLIFLSCTKPEALSLANGYGLPLKYLIDHSTRTLLEVPKKQMEDFMRVLEQDPLALCTEVQEYRPGQRVRVIAGNLEGVEGDVISVEAHTYLQLSLCGLLSARIQIPAAYVEPV